MIYLEEHREVGDSVERAEVLADEHKEYVQMAKVCFYYLKITTILSLISFRRMLR